ncbi:MAG: dethiobiotin synthase [Burkholderiales bacterium]|nr:dethiobiotin synthase [Burkholderiales bacterium]
MKKGFFVTGTDTGIGKTFASCALLHAFSASGKSAAGMKCVSAGGDDAQWLERASSIPAPARLANPYPLKTPASPHIAAGIEGIGIETERIAKAYGEIRSDVVIVEGVGGFLVPLNERELVSDLAKRLSLPVIVVVGMRLGCISHALLTFAAIRSCGLPIAGWIANRIDPEMSYFDENIDYLAGRKEAPLLGILPHGVSPDEAARFLDLSKL